MEEGLQVLRSESGFPHDPRQHSWSDLISIMKCENVIALTFFVKDDVRSTTTTLDRPPGTEECG